MLEDEKSATLRKWESEAMNIGRKVEGKCPSIGIPVCEAARLMVITDIVCDSEASNSDR